MRISDVGNFTTCEAMALQERPPAKSMSAAVLVGNLAHALVAGQTSVDVPERIRWDSLTPNNKVAMKQAWNIKDKVDDLLEQSYPQVTALEYEVDIDSAVTNLFGDTMPYDTGRIDIMGVCHLGGVILDLKTGRDIGAAWLQLGGYLASFEKSIEAVLAGILHVPRMAIGKDQVGTLELREREILMVAWDVQRDRILDIEAHGHHPMRSPGSHCKYCPVTDCVVRAVESIYGS